MKKLVSLLLSLLLMAGLASAAVAVAQEDDLGYGFHATGERIVDDEITIHVLYDRDTRHGDFDKMWFIDYVAEKTGIRLEFELVESAAWTERVNIAFATGDYPDVFMHNFKGDMVSKYAAEGYLVDLAPYIKQYAPDTVAEYNKYPELVREITGENGAIYFMPSINASPRDMITTYPLWINKSWLDNLGLEVPTTLDEFYTVLKAFKEQDANGDGDPNNEIPAMGHISTAQGVTDKLSIAVLSALGFVDRRNGVQDDQYVFVPTTENYKEYLKFMHKLFDEGLVSNEFLNMTDEAETAYESSGLCGVMSESPYNVLPDTYEAEWVALSPLTSEMNSTHMWPAQSACNTSWGSCVVTDKCQYVEAVVRLIDWFYTVEGSRAVRAGCEYGTWADEDGVEYGWEIVTPAEETEDGHLIAKLHMGDYSSYFACRLGEIGPTNLPFNSTDAVNDIVIAGDKMNLWLYNQTMESGCVEARTFALPVLSYTDEEYNELSTFVDLMSEVDRWEALFIRGDMDIDENWDAFQQSLVNLRVDDMCKIYQTAYDRYLEKPEQLTLE